MVEAEVESNQLHRKLIELKWAVVDKLGPGTPELVHMIERAEACRSTRTFAFKRSEAVLVDQKLPWAWLELLGGLTESQIVFDSSGQVLRFYFKSDLETTNKLNVILRIILGIVKLSSTTSQA